MSIRGLKKMALLLTFWVALQGRCLRADQTVTGNLTVTGSNVYMGEQVSTTNPGWGTIYTDGTNSTVEFQGTRSGNTWEWQQSDGSIVQMTLDNTNTVTLYNQSGTAEITPGIFLLPKKYRNFAMFTGGGCGGPRTLPTAHFDSTNAARNGSPNGCAFIPS